MNIKRKLLHCNANIKFKSIVSEKTIHRSSPQNLWFAGMKDPKGNNEFEVFICSLINVHLF
jgi:hypothetical protein